MRNRAAIACKRKDERRTEKLAAWLWYVNPVAKRQASAAENIEERKYQNRQAAAAAKADGVAKETGKRRRQS